MRFGGSGRCVSLWSVGVGHGGCGAVWSDKLRFRYSVFRFGGYVEVRSVDMGYGELRSGG